MNCPLRLALILVISLLLPLSGMAGLGTPEQTCDGQSTTMADGDHSTTMAGMGEKTEKGSSCCDEEKSAQLGFKVCKTGQEDCQASVVLVLPVVKFPVISSGTAIITDFNPPVPPSSSESFWRPPRV